MNEVLTKKDYSKLSFTFMPFGSLMNSLQHLLTEDNKEKIADWAWKWSQKAVSDLVDKLYVTSDTQPGFQGQPTFGEKKADKVAEATLNFANELQNEEDEKKGK